MSVLVLLIPAQTKSQLHLQVHVKTAYLITDMHNAMP